MCEPAHSIVQYPEDFDDTNLPFGDNVSKQGRISALLAKVGDWSTKIGKFFHISKMGSGHSAAVGLGYNDLKYLPEPRLYEGYWWVREFGLDGYYRDNPIALEAARAYHQQVCMGSMQQFRRFLETSLKKTYRPTLYIDRFLHSVLTKEGRDQCVRRLRLLLPGRNPSYDDQNHRDKIIKTVMGYTRRRNLFIPTWSDDATFWGA